VLLIAHSINILIWRRFSYLGVFGICLGWVNK